MTIKYKTMIHREQVSLNNIPPIAKMAQKIEEGDTKMQQTQNVAQSQPTAKPHIVVDFEGKIERKRHFIDPDVYTTTIIGVSDIFVSKNLFDQQEESKLAINFELPLKDVNGVQVSLGLFMKAKITHSAKSKQGYSDSKLYQLLEKAGILENCKTFWQTTKDKENPEKLLVEWLRQELLGKQAKIVVKTIVSKTGEKYSVISEIVKLMGDSPFLKELHKQQEETVA